MNAQQRRNMHEFASKAVNYCLPPSEWVSGRYAGNQTARALPPHVQRIEKSNLSNVNELNENQRKAMDYFEKYPRRKVVLVLDAEEYAKEN